MGKILKYLKTGLMIVLSTYVINDAINKIKNSEPVRKKEPTHYKINMPNFKKGNYLYFADKWQKPPVRNGYTNREADNYKEGVSHTYRENITNDWVWRANYLSCYGDIMPRPFSLMDIKKQVLLVDNNPTDGYINKKLINPRGVIWDNAPDCLEKKMMEE